MTVTDTIPVNGNTAALLRARAEATARKHRDVLAALSRAGEHGEPLTLSSLAAAAGLSRPELMQGLRRSPGTASRRRG